MEIKDKHLQKLIEDRDQKLGFLRTKSSEYQKITREFAEIEGAYIKASQAIINYLKERNK